MKLITTIFIITYILLSSSLFSQDLILTKSKKEIKSKVIEIGLNEVKYKDYDNLDGPIIVILKSEIIVIKYANGKQSVVNDPKEPQANIEPPIENNKERVPNLITVGSMLSLSQIFQFRPGFTGMYDVGFSNKFSLGLAVSFQTLSGVVIHSIIGRGSGPVNRLNIGVRPLLHFGDNPLVNDFYFGGRVGCSIYDGEVFPLPSVQILFGIRHYFNNLALNYELALGTPYWLFLGFSYKL